MHKLASVLLCALLIGAVPAPQSIKIVDIMPAFWRVWDGHYTDAQRVQAFKEQVVLPNLAVYMYHEFYSNLATDASIEDYFRRVRPYIPAMRTIDARIQTQMPAEIDNVRKALPDFDPQSIYAIYVMPSLLHFNGQVHDMFDKAGVFFGVDGLAEFDGADVNFGVDLAHELFHIYQYEKYAGKRPAETPTWQDVWIEGSAAYASEKIASNATKADALGNQLASADASTTHKLACLVDTGWMSPSDDDLINAGKHPGELPPRGGYLVGYLATEQLAKSMSLAEIGKAMNDPGFDGKLHPIIHQLCLKGAL